MCERRFYLFINITPSYKLRANEDVTHDLLGRGYVHHNDAGPLEIIHQVLVVIEVLLLWEAKLHQAKIVP
jgi:hypothetical protein